jgi:hypothetical protein
MTQEPLKTSPKAEASNSGATSSLVATAGTRARVAPKLEHPVALAVDRYLQRVRDVFNSVRTHVVKALEEKTNELEKLKSDYRAVEEIFRQRSIEGQDLSIVDYKRVREFKTFSGQARHSHAPEVLLSSLYVAMFSALDTFLSSLVIALFQRKPELFGLIDRSISLEAVVRYGSVDAIKLVLLQEEIDAMRRKSYVEQFEYMEKVFGLALRQFDEWPQFVEAGQRRNLYVHCDGVVTDQYLEICKKNKVALAPGVKVGTKFFLDGKHTLDTAALMGRLGVMLGHTLWRKVLPGEAEEADEHLKAIIYDALIRERWGFAVAMSKFALSPMVSKLSSDVIKKITTINLAIALKAKGSNAEAVGLLDSLDLTASIPEFRLANAVLRDNFDEAVTIMREIGKSGELANEFAYHEWPLFRDFRSSDKFKSAYEEIYGASFASRLEQSMRKEAMTAAAEIGERQQDYQASQKDLKGEAGVVDVDAGLVGGAGAATENRASGVEKQ